MEDFEHSFEYCLRLNHQRNEHYPENYKNQRYEMDHEARIILTCELLGDVLGNARKHGINISLAECRAIIEKKNCPHWKNYALKYYWENNVLKNCLPEPSENVPELPNRWKVFPNEEIEILKKLYDILLEEYKYMKEQGEIGYRFETYNYVYSELLKLNSVKYYLTDLQYHREAVLSVYNQIPEFKQILPSYFTRSMERKIKLHDSDKYMPEVIIGYVYKWCFDKNVVRYNGMYEEIILKYY